MLKCTPLHSAHQKLGARLIEFGGWDMPVQYTGILDEPQASSTSPTWAKSASAALQPWSS